MRSKMLLLFLLFLSTGTLFGQKDFKVYVFIAEECPISIYMVKPLQEACAEFGDKAEFIAVFPLRKSDYSSAGKFKEKYQLTDFEIVLDKDQSLTKSLEATVTPEIVIVDQEGKKHYQGRISNAYAAPGKMKHGQRTNELKQVLAELTQGKSIPQPWKTAVGCYITFNPN